MWQNSQLKLSIFHRWPVFFKEMHKKRDSRPHKFYSTQCTHYLFFILHVWATKTLQFLLTCLHFSHSDLLSSSNNSAIIWHTLDSTFWSLQCLIVWSRLILWEHFKSRRREGSSLFEPMPACCGETKLPLFGRFHRQLLQRTSVCVYISHFQCLFALL